jgi:deoxycytidine triphosphate deaminase
MSVQVRIGRKHSAQMAGGVLSDGAIKDEVEAGWLIVEGFDEESLQPASYDVTVARDGLIDPDGKETGPGAEQGRDRVVLQPGDAAMFSSQEKFCMPNAVAGNITIKNRLATRGLMLLSGGLIDPGYGVADKPHEERGCRLYLHVANIGKETIEIRPGSERVARVQFLRVAGRKLDRKPINAPGWKGQKKPSLGFLSDLKHLKDSSERNRDLITVVITGGIFVLLMTMISVSLAVILSLSSDAKLVHAVKAAVPQSTSGKWLEGALALALSAFALLSTAALYLRIRRDRERGR